MAAPERTAAETSAGITDTGPSLERLLDNLGPSVGQVLAAPRGLDVPVGDSVIYDPEERTPIEPRGVVLGVGVLPDGADARELVGRAAAAGATAVVLKLHDRPCGVLREAEAGGVAVLALSTEMSWTHFHAVLSRAMASPANLASVPSLASVPTGDLFALANAIAAMIGGAVTIEDQRARVLAYSNIEGQRIDEARQQSILGRQVPDTPGVRALYRQLWASDRAIRVDTVEDLDIYPRIAVPVRVGGETLGSVWAVQDEAPFAPDAEGALEEAAKVAALHMVHARASSDIERRVRGDLLRGLLEGRDTDEPAAARLGLDPGAVLEILAFELPPEQHAVEELRRERLVDLVALYCEAFRRRAACVSMGRTVYALLPAEKPMSAERVRQLATEILEHAETTLRTPLRAAVGSPVTHHRDIPRARREVDLVLRVLGANHDGPRLASIADVRSRATLVELRDLAAGRPELMEGGLHVILEHDRMKGTSYAATLHSYLDAFGDVPLAAARIGIHANTFRYRLRRLVTLFDLNLDDADERLVLGLQLRLLPAPEAESETTTTQEEEA
jgi:DNA-binding PucR family transcriptional regulator